MLNALLLSKVSPVAILRLGAPATTALPPQCDWMNTTLAKKINAYSAILAGGCHYDGSIATPLNHQEIEACAHEIKKLGIKHIAITGVFSQTTPFQELKAAHIIKSIIPNAHITLSNKNDGSLLERENMTVTMAALHEIFNYTFESIRLGISKLGLANTKLFVSHNDGTLSPISKANPFLTLKSGPTNSLRGAGVLCPEISYAIAVDIGGTSTDAGIIKNGEPLEKNSLFNVAGINFKSPTSQVEAIALGGGTTINISDTDITLGPSIANNLYQKSLCFGGDTLTTTDIAVAFDRISPTNHIKTLIKRIPTHLLQQADNLLHQTLADLIIETRSSVNEKPNDIILVGGGACLFNINTLQTILNKHIKNSNVIVPSHANIANAIGAATAQIAGIHTEIYNLDTISRDSAYDGAVKSATKKALHNGACSKSINIKNISVTEISYINNNSIKVAAKVAGNPDFQFQEKPTNTHYADAAPVSASSKIKKYTDILDPKPIIKAASRIDNSNINLTSTTTITSEIAKKLATIIPLTKENIDARAIGYDFLGSGGGGSTRLSKLMVNVCLNQQKNIKELNLDDLPDEATVIACGFIGSPAIFEESPPSIDLLINSVLKMERISGKKTDALISMEGGGANGLVPYIVAAELSIPIINADVMGRAFPGINMITPAIYDGMEQHTVTLASTYDVIVIDANNPNELERKARTAVQDIGAMAFLSYYPFSGSVIKKLSIKDTPQLAQAIGKQFLLSKSHNENPLNAINNYLKNTDYGQIKECFSGRIIDIIKSESSGFSIGAIRINNQQKNYEVIFQNENIFAREVLADGSHINIASVPDLITVIDAETFAPIGTPEYTYGNKVRVLTIGAPSILKTKRALEVIGPSSPTYQVDKILKILNEN
jgi:DUF917 family protein